MKKSYELPVQPVVTDIVATLQDAGFETYIVGGAIRDLLLGRSPKDYDISSAATPEQIRSVFGRRYARIIGKRFRLVHLNRDGVIYELSTFRRSPRPGAEAGSSDFDDGRKPENLITSDNLFGTAEQDAWRRDFSVNALFYDPVRQILIDYTEQGLADIRNGCVRAIGEPKLRFEEDPVRMLRALKLVAQYNFAMDSKTENALFACLGFIRHASSSRLSLELEKILGSCYGDLHFQVFHDFGLLHYFLPRFCESWGSEATEYSINLLNVRNCRVSEGLYRNSVSLAMAALALPFVETECNRNPGELWEAGPDASLAIERVLGRIFKPEMLVNRMVESAQRILELQPLFAREANRGALIGCQSYAHARELLMIRCECAEEGASVGPAEKWPVGNLRERARKRPPRRRKRPVGHLAKDDYASGDGAAEA